MNDDTKRRHFCCSYNWVGAGESGVGMVEVSFDGPMSMRTISNVAKSIESGLSTKKRIGTGIIAIVGRTHTDVRLMKRGSQVTVVIMGMLELEVGEPYTSIGLAEERR